MHGGQLQTLCSDLRISCSTENEVEGIAIKGFPTLKFFKKGQKESPMDFDGDRTEEGIIKFLKENVSFPWTDSAEADL